MDIFRRQIGQDRSQPLLQVLNHGAPAHQHTTIALPPEPHRKPASRVSSSGGPLSAKLYVDSSATIT
jgi:hypothetical protein